MEARQGEIGPPNRTPYRRRGSSQGIPIFTLKTMHVNQRSQPSGSPQTLENVVFLGNPTVCLAFRIFCFLVFSVFSVFLSSQCLGQSLLNRFVRPAISADYGRREQLSVYLLLFQPGWKQWHVEFFRGREMNASLFFSHFSGPPGYPSEIPGYPAHKFGFPGFEGHTELFGPHPFT